MILKAYGKINLSLDILGRRENGYHDISTIMQSVELHDIVSVEKNDSGTISVRTNNSEVPDGNDNIAYKACKLMISKFNIDCGFDILIDKHIPVAGGMAGGSTDAASVIKAVNELCELNLSEQQLMNLGVAIGADIPFCIQQKPVLATGIGEVMSRVSGLSNKLWILIVNPNKKVSTKKIYEMIDKNLIYDNVNHKALLAALKKNDIANATRYMHNVMQEVSSELCHDIPVIIKKLKSLGAIHAMMSGSGATCFGIFDEKPDALQTEKMFDKCFVSFTKPLSFDI